MKAFDRRVGETSSTWVVLFLVVQLFATVAGGQTATDPVQDGINKSGFQELAVPGGPLSFGDPVSLGGLRANYSHVDLSLPTSIGNYALETQFTFDPFAIGTAACFDWAGWVNGEEPPVVPPVSQHGTLCTGHTNQKAIWTTSLYSYILQNAAGNYEVRLPSGEVFDFDWTCQAGSICGASNSSNSTALLSFQGSTASTFVFVVYVPGVGRYYFDRHYYAQYTDSYFLTKFEPIQYSPSAGSSRALYTVMYAETGDVGDCASSLTPLPRLVRTADGEEVRFHYTQFGTSTPSHCQLTRVGLGMPGSAWADETVYDAVDYSYSGGNGRLVSIAQPNSQTTSFAFGLGADGGVATFDVLANGTLISRKSLDQAGNDQPVRSDWTRDRTLLTFGSGWADNFDAGTCTLPTPTDPNPPPPYIGHSNVPVCEQQGYSVTYPTSGDGTGRPVTITNRNIVLDPEPSVFPGTIVDQSWTECSDVVCGGVPVDSRDFPWEYVGSPVLDGGARRSTRAVEDGRRHFTVYDAGTAVFFDSSGIGFAQFEKQGVRYGATDGYGSNAMSYESYSYSYLDAGVTPAFHEQLPRTTRAPGVTPGTEKTVVASYDAYGRPAYVETTGSTVKFDSSSGSFITLNRTLVTYTNDVRDSSYPAKIAVNGPVDVPSGQDYLGRTLETIGPCFEDEGCASAPRTQYFYYSADAGVNANKLAQKTIFTCSGVADGGCQLTTTFDAYDVWGHVLRTTDPSGVVTVNDYGAGTKLLSTTVDPGGLNLTTNYLYDDTANQVSATRHPNGQWEVFCYRYGANSDCTGGTVTSHLQWKAKAGGTNTPDYGSLTEKVTYLYDGTNGNGRLVEEDYIDAHVAGAPVVRRVLRHEVTPAGNATYEQVGKSGVEGSFATPAQFDGNGNRTAQGFAYNLNNVVGTNTGFPAFCGLTPNTNGWNDPLADPRCASMSYDFMNRLSRLTQPAAQGNQAATTITYDPAGNVQSIGTSGVSGPAVTYKYDDFGNLVSVTAPWMTDPGTGAAGTVHYAYDSQGHITYKQTPEMSTHGQYVRYSYDWSGRELGSWLHQSSGAEQLLYSYDYDQTAVRPSSCSPVSDNHSTGRIQRRVDSFGSTWYSYDSVGEILYLMRDRNLGTCASSSDNSPSSSFSYASGQLTGEVYPHGRAVAYGYGTGGDADRITSISAVVSGTSTMLLRSISYEPYAGVRSYNIIPPLNSSATMPVEYLLGANSSTPPATLACSNGRPGSSDYDQTGRLRALWVSSSTAGSGDVFKRFFTYSGDQTTIEDTCFLDNTSTTPRRVVYASAGNVANHDGYDGRLRLTNVSRPTGQLGALGGTVGRREYSYDARGNRATETEDCWKFQETYDTNSPDKLLARNSVAGYNCPASPKSSIAYAYDKDGRVASESWGSGQGGVNRTIMFDDAAWAGNGLDGVYKEVSVNGVSYQYLYDAFGRRRDKVYANATDNEFFYDDSRMIEDRDAFSAADLTQGATAAADEYIWLDGKPVVMIRAQVVADQGTGATHDGPDFGTSCDRGDGVPCGVYFLVNDAIGKPVLIIDSSGKAAGEAEYTPFGMPNRVTYIVDSPHPYTNTTGLYGDLYASLREKPAAAETVQARVRFTDIETSGASDAVYLAGATGASLGGETYGPVDPATSPWVTSPWVTVPSDGLVQARFTASQAAGFGFTIAGFDYQRYQTGARPVWTHLGFPGQYYDPETDLFENWHRYYDANIGRYLEPDPLWRYPERMLPRIGVGHFDPVYAYAGNNPMGASDPDGNEYLFNDGQGHVFDPFNMSHDSETLLAYSKNKALVDTMVNVVNTLASGPDEGVASAVSALKSSSTYMVVVQGVHFAGNTANGDTHAWPAGSRIRMESQTPITQSEVSPTEVYSSNMATSFAHELGHAAYNWANGMTGPLTPEQAIRSGWSAIQMENYYRTLTVGPLAVQKTSHSQGEPPLPASSWSPPSLAGNR